MKATDNIAKSYQEAASSTIKGDEKSGQNVSMTSEDLKRKFQTLDVILLDWQNELDWKTEENIVKLLQSHGEDLSEDLIQLEQQAEEVDAGVETEPPKILTLQRSITKI